MTTVETTETDVINCDPDKQQNDRTHPVISAGKYQGDYQGIHLFDDDGNRVKLTNFVAKIVADIIQCDGDHKERFYEIEATVGDDKRIVVVPTCKFASLTWVDTELGGRAMIEYVPSAKRHVEMAIRKFSSDMLVKEVYTHTGWTCRSGENIFMASDTIIGSEAAADGVEVALPDDLAGYRLPEPAPESDIKGLFRMMLELFDAGPDSVTIPLLGATFRSVMGKCDFSMHVYGPSGSRKSSVCGVYQAFFGTQFGLGNLPASWGSTELALQDQMHAAKDTILVIDDYIPNDPEAQRKAATVFRSQGNLAGRSRLSGGGKRQAGRQSRCLVISTGEGLVDQHSLRARQIIIPIGPSDIDLDQLRRLEGHARRGRFTRLMSSYIAWLAGRIDAERTGMDAALTRYQDQFILPGLHARTPKNLSQLALGLDLLLQFAHETRAIDTHMKTVLSERFKIALTDLGKLQIDYQASADPVEQFFRLLRSAFDTGRAHMTRLGKGDARFNDCPSWGWRPGSWRPKGGHCNEVPAGPRIGWLGPDNFRKDTPSEVYLIPEAAYRAVQSAAVTSSERLPISQQELWRQLDERGYLKSTEYASRRARTTRVMIEGQRRAVIHMDAEVVRNQG